MTEPDIVVYVRICGLCGEEVSLEHITSIHIPSMRLGGIEFNAHVSCLHDALHPSVRGIFDPEDVRLPLPGETRRHGG